MKPLERFLDCRSEAVATGNLDKFLALYESLFEILFGEYDLTDETWLLLRNEFLSYAETIGRRQIQEVQELETLYEAESE